MPDKKRAQKINHQDLRNLQNPSILFAHSIGGRLGEKRLMNRILEGRHVKPCGRECREYGIMIAAHFDHGSFENFNELMNDEEFLLEIAGITPSPAVCVNYFYQYINPFITRKEEFRLAFLKRVYLNPNVYKLEDINAVVEICGLEKENQIILNDENFKRLFEKRINGIDYQDMITYSCSGEDKKELHKYKVKVNEFKVLCENMKNGLTEILETFVKEKKEEDVWAFLWS